MIQRNKTHPHITYLELELVFRCENCHCETPLNSAGVEGIKTQAIAFKDEHKNCKGAIRSMSRSLSKRNEDN